VLPAEAHRAYALLREPSALRALLDDKLNADDKEAEEVALPLSAQTPSARLIVNREGRGVTCLASTMATPAPTLVWAVVERFLERQDQQLKARIAASRDEGKADNQKPLLRALRFAYRLTRDEYDAIVPLMPLVQDDVFKLCGKVVTKTAKLRRTAQDKGGKRWPLKGDGEVDAFWREYTAAALQLTLLDEHPGSTELRLATLSTGDAQLSFRALWTLVRRPQRTLDALDMLIAHASKPPVAGLAMLLSVIAARFPDLRGRCENTHARAKKRFDALEDLSDGHVRQAPYGMLLMSALPLLLWRYPPRDLRTDDGAERFKARVGEVQRAALLDNLSLPEMAGRVGGWMERVVELLDPYRHVDQRQAWKPYGGSPDSKEERVRLILWRAIIRDLRRPVLGLPDELLALLSAAPLDAVLPPERPDVSWRVRAGREYLRELLPTIFTS
jgi:hypothetical protein